MKLTTKYVGSDVHRATTVASVRDDSGRVIAEAVNFAMRNASGCAAGLRCPNL
jgi:hypothetical protein